MLVDNSSSWYFIVICDEVSKQPSCEIKIEGNNMAATRIILMLGYDFTSKISLMT
jgi:hypothetical protein